MYLSGQGIVGMVMLSNGKVYGLIGLSTRPNCDVNHQLPSPITVLTVYPGTTQTSLLATLAL